MLKGLPVAELLCAGEAPGDAGQDPAVPVAASGSPAPGQGG